MRDLVETPDGRWISARQDHVDVRVALEAALFRAQLWRKTADTPTEGGRAAAVVLQIEETLRGLGD